jgi:hypothetical protein
LQHVKHRLRAQALNAVIADPPVQPFRHRPPRIGIIGIMGGGFGRCCPRLFNE